MKEEFDFEEDDKEIEEPIVTKIIDLDEKSFDKEEIESNITNAVLCYIGFLFLIPLLTKKYKESKYLLFHVNQGFSLFALEIFVLIVLGLFNSLFINSIGYSPLWLSIVNFIFYSLIVILMLLGILNVVNGKSKVLPIIGKYKFIK